MNFAFSTLAIFIFLLPGIAFRRFYFSEEFSKQFSKSSLFAVFFSTLPISLAFHTVWFLGANVFGYQVNLEVISKIFWGPPSEDFFSNVYLYQWEIVLYNVSMLIMAVFLGRMTMKAVRFGRWDRFLKLFRFQNYHHYLLTGEFFDFPRAFYDLDEDEVQDIDLVAVDALVNSSEGSIIYNGILVDYFLSQNGDLEEIILKEVERRFLVDDPGYLVDEEEHHNDENTDSDIENFESTFYEVPGHIMSLKYGHIVNLNITFYRLEPTENEGEFDLQILS